METCGTIRKRDVELVPGIQMPGDVQMSLAGQLEGRRELARERLPIARAMLSNCHFCEHHCGVDRADGEMGVCRAGDEPRVFSAQIEVSDELEFIPVFSIAFSGCDLHCDFCITGHSSWHSEIGEVFSAVSLARRAEAAVRAGARSIMLLGGEPTIHLPAVLEVVSALPQDVLLIWKTNAHASAEARMVLDGLFDVWLADYKFGNDMCAAQFATAPDYTRIVRENLLWANQHSELVVRHLLMPGHVECCWRPVAEWLSNLDPVPRVNLRSGFWPASQARCHPELWKPVSERELERAHQIAQDCALTLIS